MVRIKVSVTQQDIDNGRRQDPFSCPIALSLRRAFGAEQIRIESHRIIIGNQEYRPSKRMKTFIHKFDSGKSVEPQTFIVKDRGW